MKKQGISLPLVGSTDWHKFIKVARKAGLLDNPADVKGLVKLRNKQHDELLKTGKVRATDLNKQQYSGSRGIGAARSFKPAPTAKRHSIMSASASFF